MTEPLWRGWCGTMEVHRRLLETDPSYATSRAEVENFTFEVRRRRRALRDTVVAIPVVVHVVWNGPEQNISDEQVASQIAALNADYRARNPDRGRVPEVWKDLVGDAKVQFALATVDPAGEPTTGVTRTRTPVTAFDTDDAVKAATTGGADAWPTDRYLNLWCCPLGGGLLGYAQFPGGPATTDGVVILHSAFGTTGTAAAMVMFTAGQVTRMDACMAGPRSTFLPVGVNP